MDALRIISSTSSGANWCDAHLKFLGCPSLHQQFSVSPRKDAHPSQAYPALLAYTTRYFCIFGMYVGLFMYFVLLALSWTLVGLSIATSYFGGCGRDLFTCLIPVF